MAILTYSSFKPQVVHPKYKALLTMCESVAQAELTQNIGFNVRDHVSYITNDLDSVENVIR